MAESDPLGSPSVASLSDKQLFVEVARAFESDPVRANDAFAEFYRRHQMGLLTIARRLSAPDPEAVVHDVILTELIRCRAGKIPNDPLPYVRAGIRNRAKRVIGRGRKWTSEGKTSEELAALDCLFIRPGISGPRILEAEEGLAVFCFAARQWLAGTEAPIPPSLELIRAMGSWDRAQFWQTLVQTVAAEIDSDQFGLAHLDLFFLHADLFLGRSHDQIACAGRTLLEGLAWQISSHSPRRSDLERALRCLAKTKGRYVKGRLSKLRVWMDSYLAKNGYKTQWRKAGETSRHGPKKQSPGGKRP